MASYEPSGEKITLAEAFLGDPPEQTSVRLRARQACASSNKAFQWMRIDVCAYRGGGTLPAALASPIASSRDAEKHFRAFLGSSHLEIKEIFGVIALDSRNQPLGFYVPGIGSANHVIVPAIEVFKPAVLLPAPAIVLCHNHPSGDPMASREDIEFTLRLLEIGKVLGIQILDHLILTHNKSYSMVDAGLMKPG